MQPLISVIVPVYKVEDYLKQCVLSLINQRYSNLEIILVDDGSPDKCGEICDEFAKKDSRIKVIHKKNGGLSDARNVALEIVKGDYIGFVDSDDWINVNMYKVLMDLALKHSADISECKFVNVYDREEISHRDKKYNVRIFNNIGALENHFNGEGIHRCVWNKIYKRELFNDIRFPKGKVAEDLFTTYKLFFKAEKIVLTDFEGYYYYIRPNSIMGNGGLNLAIATFEGMKEQHKFVCDNVPMLKERLNTLYFNCLIKTYSLLEQGNWKESVEEYKKAVSKELERDDIEVRGITNIFRILYKKNPSILSLLVDRVLNKRER